MDEIENTCISRLDWSEDFRRMTSKRLRPKDGAQKMAPEGLTFKIRVDGTKFHAQRMDGTKFRIRRVDEPKVHTRNQSGWNEVPHSKGGRNEVLHSKGG